MDVGARADRKPFEEVVDEFGLQIADPRRLYTEIDDSVRPTAKVDRRDRQRLVHRHDEIAGAVDPAPIAQGFRDRFSERDAEVFDGMVLIDVEIALRVDGQIEAAVPREQLEHVVQKPDTGPDLVLTAAIERDPQRN